MRKFPHNASGDFRIALKKEKAEYSAAMMKNSPPSHEDRQALKEQIKAAGTNPTALARAIGRGKDYVRDFLAGRKEDFSSSEWDAIMSRLAGREMQPASNGIPQEHVQALAEVLLGIACKNDTGIEDFARVLAESLQGPIKPPPRVPPLDHLRSSLHNKVLEFVTQVNARSEPRTHS